MGHDLNAATTHAVPARDTQPGDSKKWKKIKRWLKRAAHSKETQDKLAKIDRDVQDTRWEVLVRIL